MLLPFFVNAKTKAYSLTDTASSSAPLPDAGAQVRVLNEGPDNGYIAVGQGLQAATLPTGTPAITATPVMAGTDVILNLPVDSTGSGGPFNISGICRSGKTATLIVQVGTGF